MPTATVYIHGGDYDCSELVRMCYRAVGVLPYGSYMWTGNETELLTTHGFVRRGTSDPKVGDVLYRAGHTEIYLGNGLQGGARISEHGTTNGAKGDQTGGEIGRSAYRASSWSYILRYEGGKDCDGIPCAIAAALVADHLIDHSAHGYSQPNRAGDGSVEEVTIRWDGGQQDFTPCKLSFTFNREVKVRTSPDASRSDNLMSARWKRGQTMATDGIVVANGYVWGTYIGPTTGRRLYSAMWDVREAYGTL